MHEQLAMVLADLGLDEKQIRVYLACLETGGAGVGEIAKRSGVKRTSIYNFLDEMKTKGFLSEVRREAKSVLVPEDPKVLAGRANERAKRFEGLLPEFSAIFNKEERKARIRYYEGEEGLKSMYEDILQEGETTYEISDFERMFSAMNAEWIWKYPDRRAEKQIRAYSIAKEGPMARQVRAKDRSQMRETRFVEKVDFETEINIYGNKVALLSFQEPLMGVIIEDKAIAQTLRSMWRIIWQSLG